VRLDGTFMLMYIDGRILFTASLIGGATDTVDVLVDDTGDLETAVGSVLGSMQRQLVRTVTAKAT
jgi:hypothetical protein